MATTTYVVYRPIEPTPFWVPDEWIIEDGGACDCGKECWTALCFPSVSYAKTEMRLARAEAGEDPFHGFWSKKERRAYYRPFDCFKKGPEVHQQRMKIREKYGITEESISDEPSVSAYCYYDILLQNDYEVQAREGNRAIRPNYRYCPEYPKCLMRQPGLQSPMRYESQVDLNDQQHSDSTKAGKIAHKLTKDERRRLIDNPAGFCGGKHTCKNKLHGISIQLLDLKTMDIVPDVPTVLVPQPEIMPMKHKATEGIPDSNESKPRKKKYWLFQVRGPESAHFRIPAPPPHDKQETIQSKQLENSSLQASQQAQSTVKINQPYSTIDPLAVRNDIEAAENNTTHAGEHDLGGCHTLQPSEVETSYVHDFSDCPVDKRVLDYYENEERRAQESSSCSQGRARSMTVMPLSDTIVQHALKDCDGDGEGGSYPENIHIAAEQHTLDACVNDGGSHSETSSNSAEQHALDECDDVSGSHSGNIHIAAEQHTLDDCSGDMGQAFGSNSNPSTRSASYSHGLGRRTAEMREHRLVSCPPALYGPNDSTAMKKHITDKGKQAVKEADARSLVIVSEELEADAFSGNTGSKHKRKGKRSQMADEPYSIVITKKNQGVQPNRKSAQDALGKLLTSQNIQAVINIEKAGCVKGEDEKEGNRKRDEVLPGQNGFVSGLWALMTGAKNKDH